MGRTNPNGISEVCAQVSKYQTLQHSMTRKIIQWHWRACVCVCVCVCARACVCVIPLSLPVKPIAIGEQ